MTADRSADDAAVRRQIEADYRVIEAEGLSPLVPTEVARRNRIAAHAAEHRPQPHELRRGTGETPAAWHGAPA